MLNRIICASLAGFLFSMMLGCGGHSDGMVDIPADNPYAITPEQEKMMLEKQRGGTDLRKEMQSKN